jgi:O-antigen/teichoic acid export membrane protein
MTSEPSGNGATGARTAANSLFSFAAFVVSAAFVAVTTPIVVHHLGAEQYGIFSLSLAIVSFLNLLDVGISTALVRFIADRSARRDVDGINRLAAASFALYVALGLVGVAVTVVVVTAFTNDLFNLSASAVPSARFAFVAAGIAFFFTFIGKTFGAVILGLQRNDVAAAIRIAITASTGVGTIVLVYLGYGVRALVSLVAAVALGSLGGYVLLARRLVPELAVHVKPDRQVLMTTLRFSAWIFLANTSAFLLFQLDRFFLGALKSVSLVTYYAVPGSAASYIFVAVANLAGITIAVATGLFARDEQNRVVELYFRATRFVWLFLLAVAVPVLILARPILEFWIGATFADRSTTVLRLLVLTYVVLSLAVVPYNVILAAGRPRILGLVNCATFLINLTLILVLVPPYGLVGAAWAYLLSVIPLGFFVFYAETRVLHVSPSHWLTLAMRFAIPIIATAALSFVLLKIVTNLAGVVAALAAGSALFALIYLLCFADAADRGLVLQLARGIGRTAGPTPKDRTRPG